jgi:hypothetical protein
LTVRTLHRDRDHRLPPRANVVYDEYTGKLPICNITECVTGDGYRHSFVPPNSALRLLFFRPGRPVQQFSL